ncbi:MAG TPA: hypothetical protein VN106_07900 [Sphingomicrobium sp.]|jgi:hypothetical protein|nr:hypothetical protein [Sphingomicrobium sp.]
MKYAIGIALFCWLLCGAVGAWMQDDLDGAHWKMVAYGGITLANAMNQDPVTFTGSN